RAAKPDGPAGAGGGGGPGEPPGALERRVPVELPAAEGRIDRLGDAAQVLPAATEWQLGDLRQHEDVRAVPVRRAAVHAAVVDEVVAAILYGALPGVVRQHRIAMREAFVDLGLQRVVAVVGAVAEVVDALRPAE